METITIFGVKLPKYKDCPRCGKKDGCVFDRCGYRPVCWDCYESLDYQEEQKRKDEENRRLGIGGRSIDQIMKDKVPAAMWEGKGRQIVTNRNGDIIANVPAKPRPLGRKDWKI